MLVFPERTLAWPVTRVETLTAADLRAVIEAPVELLLLGTGPRMAPVPAGLSDAMRAAEVTVEPMDTGAACRTFNVLVAEARRVAAALIAVD